jgi:DNA-binding transcriptional MocR family regulator
MRLHESLAQELARAIRSGGLKVGDALPSVRALCRTRRISTATVQRAYEHLIDDGLIESRPRSGYFVRAAPAQPPQRYTPPARSTTLKVSDLVFETLSASRHRDTVPLGSAFPSPLLFPWQKLARLLGRGARHMDPWSTVESLPPGSPALRRQIARRYLKLGMSIDPEEIVITAGALEALNLALATVTRPGDTLAVESPAFYGCLQAAERQQLKVVEIPSHPGAGLDLAALAAALERGPIHACWCMTTLQHPTGTTLSLERKRELVRLLARHRVPLIEDDAYAELQFADPPLPPAKFFDEGGGVLHCGSFSKCLAPGYRVGWVAGGRFSGEIVRRKLESSIATSLPVQLAIAEMLQAGGYETHLARLRRALGRHQSAALESIRRHFPRSHRLLRPDGGYFLWIECDPSVDALDVHRAALHLGITIAPGPIFSARQQYRSCIRLNYGHPWTADLDAAVAQLARLLRSAG